MDTTTEHDALYDHDDQCPAVGLLPPDGFDDDFEGSGMTMQCMCSFIACVRADERRRLGIE